MYFAKPYREELMKSPIKALGLCIAVVAGLSVSIPSFGATTLRIGTVLAPDDPMGQGLDKFKAEVEAATKGEVVIQIFHNSQLGDTTEMIDQARAGANVGTITDVARLSSFVPSLAIMSAPFLFDTFEQPMSQRCLDICIRNRPVLFTSHTSPQHYYRQLL